MKDITNLFSETFIPVKALLFYQSIQDQSFYIESHDLDNLGMATNVHPLNEKESHELSLKLRADKNKEHGFLNHTGLLPENLLCYNTREDGGAMWFTQSMSANLYFSKSLSIPDGMAQLPPLIWKASKTRLQIWAMKEEQRPRADTDLFLAPFFNLYHDGRVCMGNVDIKIPKDCNLTQFMELWMKYFFASTFSHLLTDTSPVKMNIVQLWQSLIATGKDFPLNQLKKTNLQLKDIPL